MTTALASEWDSTPLSGIVHTDTERSMDQKVKALYVAALRSGLYEQGYDRLRDGNTFTALGVLCDLAVRSKTSICVWDILHETGEYFIAPLNPEECTGGYLPLPVREWAGIKGTHPSQELPLRTKDGDLHPIWRLSDIFKLTFVELADLIEDQY